MQKKRRKRERERFVRDRRTWGEHKKTNERRRDRRDNGESVDELLRVVLEKERSKKNRILDRYIRG